jgi:hypothetical protein
MRSASAATASGNGGPTSSTSSSPYVGQLVRSQTVSTVYYVGVDGRRYVFPNETTYFTWYPNFNGVQFLPDATIAAMPIGPLVPLRPGIKLMKYPSVPKVFAVEPGGQLRWIPDEATLTRLGYRLNQVVDMNEAFVAGYHEGPSLTGPADGSVVAPAGGTQLYIIRNGLRRPISQALLSQHRYFANHVRYTEPALLNQLPLGSPVETYEPSLEGHPDGS